MDREKVSVTDAGSPHKYFSMIPHTVVRGTKGAGLSLPARWLYVYLKSIVGEGGCCTRSTSTMAREAQLSRGAISQAKTELLAARLITIAPRHHGYHDADEIRLVDLWPENMAEFGCSPDVPGCSPDVPGCSPDVPGCSPGERKKILREDLKKELKPKERGNARARAIGLPMPDDLDEQAALKATVFDARLAVWLEARYPHVDAHAQWDWFVRYCLARGRTYANFRAAFQNSFGWEHSPAGGWTGRGAKVSHSTYDLSSWVKEQEAAHDTQ